MIIVGGGIIGLSCAWRLAQRGVQVRLFDARELAAEASWAGAGMLAPGGEVGSDSSLAQMAIASLRLYDSFVQELRDASGLEIDYRVCGAMELAFNDREAAELDRRAAAQLDLGIRSERAPGGRYYPNDAVVDPRHVNAALKLACARLGVTFHEHEPVVEIDPGGNGIRTTRGEYIADGVILAAGAWSSQLCPALPAVTPVRGHLLAYAPIAGRRLDSLLRHGHTYLVPRRSGVIVAGSSTEHAGFDRAIDDAITADIHRRACELLPDLHSAAITSRWSGFRPHIDGEVPFVGRVPGTALWAACGHYRNGILLAPETARKISDGIQTAA
jgi:glycine oxidase